MMENKIPVWKPPTSHYKTHHKAIIKPSQTHCKPGINPHIVLKPYINHYIYKPLYINRPLYKIHHIPSILSTLSQAQAQQLQPLASLRRRPQQPDEAIDGPGVEDQGGDEERETPGVVTLHLGTL